LKMVILHDLAESIIGDYMPGEITKKQKLLQERNAMNSILCSLPYSIRANYRKIWQEYILNKTDVAHFVHRVDKLEMALQARQYAKEGYSCKILAQFFNSAGKCLFVDKRIFVNELLNALKPIPIK
jgi:putative hydrolase of HD superfamily